MERTFLTSTVAILLALALSTVCSRAANPAETTASGKVINSTFTFTNIGCPHDGDSGSNHHSQFE